MDERRTASSCECIIFLYSFSFDVLLVTKPRISHAQPCSRLGPSLAMTIVIHRSKHLQPPLRS